MRQLFMLNKKLCNSFSRFGYVIFFAQVLASSGFAAKKENLTTITQPKETATAVLSHSERYENLSLFQKVLFFVEQNYVEEVKNKDLVYGAIKGMLETLDPHSNFLPPEIFKDMKIDTSGKFGGIGIELGMKDSALTVISPIEDSPAFRQGIKANDRIIKINGEATKGLNLVEAVAKMRGKRGSPIVLSIFREGFQKPKDFKIVREEIKIKTVKSDVLEPGYVYARLTNFNEHSADDLKKVFKDFEKKNPPGTKIKGMVLDLRNNPGGLLDQAVDVTSLFLDEGIVVSTMGRNAESKEIKYAKKGFAHKDFPVAVLVNASSASASEIVAGALQDHKRAVIMGQPTFGKGSVQTVIELQPEVGLKLTIARYYTPSGKSIQSKGIQPDILIDEIDQKALDKALKKTNFLREKDLRRHMNAPDEEKNEKPYVESDDVQTEKNTDKKSRLELDDDDDQLSANRPYDPKKDYQVKEAFNYLKGYSIFKTAVQ